MKQINFDGEFEYGPVIHIEQTQNQSISIFPNPVKDRITVIGMGDFDNTQVGMSIVSASGQHFIDESGTLQEATLSLNKKIESKPLTIPKHH